MPKSKVTIISYCKGRLSQLKDCLPTWIALEGDSDILVVDYNCPDGTEKYIDSLKNKKVSCYKEPVSEGYWNLNKARNAGYRHADGDVLLFLDADTVLEPNFLSDALQKLKPGAFVTGLTSPPWNGCGCMLIYKNDFEQVRGYNELMEGWGYDDIDMYERLKASGLEQSFFEPSLIVNNTHESRNAFHADIDQYETLGKNKAISDSKAFKSVIPTGMHITFYNSGIDPQVLAHQKAVFEHFGIEITQVLTELPHGEAIDHWLNNNEFSRIHIWDVDAIPTTSEIPTDPKKLCGIAQQAHHIEGKPIYVGVAYITFTETMWKKWGKPSFAPTETNDTGGEVTLAAGGFEKCKSIWPLHVVQPKWDLGENSTFGLGTTYQGGIYHAFEVRLNNGQMFIEKCKEVLGG
jgi:glycosyltransferase involved in cell wall biosynthesis